MTILVCGPIRCNSRSSPMRMETHRVARILPCQMQEDRAARPVTRNRVVIDLDDKIMKIILTPKSRSSALTFARAGLADCCEVPKIFGIQHPLARWRRIAECARPNVLGPARHTVAAVESSFGVPPSPLVLLAICRRGQRHRIFIPPPKPPRGISGARESILRRALAALESCDKSKHDVSMHPQPITCFCGGPGYYRTFIKTLRFWREWPDSL